MTKPKDELTATEVFEAISRQQPIIGSIAPYHGIVTRRVNLPGWQGGKTARMSHAEKIGKTMSRVKVTIMGIPINIMYTINEPSYVEWRIEAAVGIQTQSYPKDEMEMLNILLRTHYSPFIEAACREAFHFETMAQNYAADDWMDSLKYMKGVKKIFEDYTQEDIPF